MSDEQQENEPLKIEEGGRFEGEGFIRRANGEIVPFKFQTDPLEKSED